MTEIGATLREARMHAGLDITEVERVTKIRTKYLRALEDEEWGVLPGPTFVKSFLRTYGDYLGLDSRLLVEEFKRRYEKPTEADLSPLTPPGPRRGREGRREPRRGVTPIVVGIVIVAIIAGLYALGTLRQGSSSDSTSSSTTSAKSTHHKKKSKAHKAPAKTAPAKPSSVSVQLVATGPVYACMVDDAGNKLVAGQTLAAGTTTKTYHAKKFLLTLGNAAVQLKVNGRAVPVAPSSSPISLQITPQGRKTLTAAQAPSCT